MGKIEAACISSGRPPLLSLDDEAKLVKHIEIIATFGYGYTRSEVAKVASDYAVQIGHLMHHLPEVGLKVLYSAGRN